MRRGWVEIGLLGGIIAGACVDLQPFLCTNDEDCNSAGDQLGRCEGSGYCSYPDDDCESRRRYSDLAGPLARLCTEAEPSAGSSTETTETPPSTTTGPMMDSSGTDDSGTDSDTGPTCGDARVDPGEDCDDGNEDDYDGCSNQCVAAGAILWEQTVSGAAGEDDRYFGLTSLASDEVVAAGFIQDTSGNEDVLLSRWPLDGVDPRHVIYDVGGGDDDPQAVIQGGLGRLYVCGRAQVGMSTQPWFARWDASLPDEPEFSLAVPGVSGFCHDIAYVDDNDIVAVGGNGNSAWAYTFASTNPEGGTVAQVDGVASNEIDTNFKAAGRSPAGQLFVAGQLSDLAVVYTPPADNDLGLPLLTTKSEIQPQSMVVTQETYILAGLSRDSGADDDLWIAEYDGNTPLWAYEPMMPAIDEVEDITRDPAGNLYAIGHVTEDNNNPDRWVGKLDPAGNLLWQRNDYPMSEVGNDRGRSIEVFSIDEDGDGEQDELALFVVAEIVAEGGDLDAWIARLAP